jgi:hypothetical protein
MVTRWDINNHSLSGSSQKYPIGIPQIALIVGICNSAPTVAAKSMVTPSRVAKPEIGIPGYAGPINLQSLDIVFCSRIFKVIAGSCIFFAIQKPVHWVHGNPDVNCIGF